VPWRYVLGWANHVVVPEQPDLVFLYGIGLENDLEKIFETLRRHTTADIVVASVHWKADDVKNWGKNVYRAGKPMVDFQGKGGEFRVNLFQALPNQTHVLELITVGDGKVTVKSFDIFEPPLR